MPAWLTNAFHIAKVQPKLMSIKVREIAQAIRASHPYAALVRSGRQLPHVRHWEVLAKLASLQIRAETAAVLNIDNIAQPAKSKIA